MLELVTSTDDGRTIDPKTDLMEGTKFIVRSQLRIVWPNMPESFYGWQLVNRIRDMTGLHHVYGDTILRYLRELKDQGWLDYEVKCRKTSLYVKRELKNVQL